MGQRGVSQSEHSWVVGGWSGSGVGVVLGGGTNGAQGLEGGVRRETADHEHMYAVHGRG